MSTRASTSKRLPKERAERIVELLRYPEDTVGGIMTNDVVSVPASFTCEEARFALRNRLKGPDFAHLIYVVEGDETRTLRCAASLRDIVMANENKRMEDPHESLCQHAPIQVVVSLQCEDRVTKCRQPVTNYSALSSFQ